MRAHIKTFITHLTFGIGAILLVLMVLQITLNAVLRALFDAPLDGSVEIVTNYYMVGFSFLPMALAHVEGRHIDASFVHDKMRPAFRMAADWLAQILSVVVVGLILYQSCLDAVKKTAVKAYAISGTSQIPIWICYWALPVCFGLLLLTLLIYPIVGRAVANPAEMGVE